MAADCTPDVRRLQELCACSSLYGGDRLIILNQDWQQIVQDVLAGRLDAEAMDAAAISGLASSSCSGRLNVETASFTAELVFCMPVDYPVSGALQCHVECGQLSRQAADQFSQQVQQTAASLQGSESLFEVAEALHTALEQLQVQPSPDKGPTSTPVPGNATSAAAPADTTTTGSSSCRRVLLQLDHMRAKASYSKTIMQWAAELQLTGWLLFCGPLILILLEGGSSAIADYLLRARTVCVDVDSSGRKCRERMMSVLEDSHAAGLTAGCGTFTAEQLWSGGASCSNFRMLECRSFDEVCGCLASAGLPQYSKQVLMQLLGKA